MTSNLTPKQDVGIRESLPLKIFDQRKEAQAILENIEYLKGAAQKAKEICHASTTPYFTLEGEDGFGNSRKIELFLGSNSYELVKNALLEGVLSTIKMKEEQYAEIPNAKIIPVDFRSKKIDPDTRPEPVFKPKYDQLPDGATAIYQGAWNICKALDMGFKSNDIPNLVKEKGLPAFKANGKKHWYALELDLMIWKQKEQRMVNHES